ncbi:MAG: SDR family oxidoreductase [Rhodobacteraceae bacterium]|nr:SDR family oxidoreductase [Paracoccaceae bacterium]
MPATPAPFHNLSAVVFGGGRTAAAATAQALTDAGANVVVCEPDAVRPPDHVKDLNFVVIGTGPHVGRGLGDLTAGEFRDAAAAQIVRPWLILKHTLPLLRTRPAAVVMILPRAGRRPARDNIFDCAAFGALQSMFKSLALECGRDHPHVRVNAVMVGDTEAPETVTDSILHLLSPEADFMTGALVGETGGAP